MIDEQDPTASMSADEADFARSRGQHVEPLQEPTWRPSREDSRRIEYGTIERASLTLTISQSCDRLNALEAEVARLTATNTSLLDLRDKLGHELYEANSEVARLTPLAGLAEEARAIMHKYMTLFPENERRIWAARYDALKAQEPS